MSSSSGIYLDSILSQGNAKGDSITAVVVITHNALEPKVLALVACLELSGGHTIPVIRDTPRACFSRILPYRYSELGWYVDRV